MFLVNFKKITLIIAILVFGLLSAFGIYWFFFRPAPQPSDYYTDNNLPGGQLPGSNTGTNVNIVGEPGSLPNFSDQTTVQTGGLMAPGTPTDAVARGSSTAILPLTQNRVSGAGLSGDGKSLIFYDQNEGKFYRLSNDGQEKYLLSNQEFHQVQSVVWSGDKNKAIIEYPDGSNIYYDFHKDQAVTLPKEMEEPSFTDSSDKIAFKFVTENEDDNWLVVSSPDGESLQPIEPIGDKSYLVQVGWSPNSNIVAFYHKSAGIDREEIFLVGQYGENFKSMIVNGMGFKGVWSPLGDKVLYHVISGAADYKPVLWVVGVKGSEIGFNNSNLGLNTWVDKCTFSSGGTIVYCAVPKDLSVGAGLYPEIDASQADDFYRINLSTGLKELIASPFLDNAPAQVNVGELFVSNDEQFLFFWDTITEKIYRLRLK